MERLKERRKDLIFKTDIHFRHGNDFRNNTGVKSQEEEQFWEHCMELDSLDHVMEINGISRYRFAMEIAKDKGVDRVFDIGCAYGHQSEVFVGSGVEYVGINENRLDFWNKDKYEYIIAHYPFPISTNNDMAVSILCLFWNCYLHEGEETLVKQLEHLSRDFKKALLYIPREMIQYVAKGYDKHETYDNGMVYFERA